MNPDTAAPISTPGPPPGARNTVASVAEVAAGLGQAELSCHGHTANLRDKLSRPPVLHSIRHPEADTSRDDAHPF